MNTGLSWHTETRKVCELIPWDRNPHVMDDKERQNLANSIERFDYVEVIIINTDNRIIGGHQRRHDLIAKGRGDDIIDVRVPSRPLTEKEFEELAIRLNKNRGHDDEELLKAFFNQDDLADWGFDSDELQKIYGSAPDVDFTPQNLQEKFGVPPFSVFDSRQGYWQQRKKEWNDIGFDSQETREDVELVAKSGQSPAVYALRNEMRKELKREPEWDEIIAEAKKRDMHIYSGASVFDPVLTEICYKWFCPPGGDILDPFAGGSVRGIVAGMLGYGYYGIDLRPDQVAANRAQAKLIEKKLDRELSVYWREGDSNKELDSVTGTYDFVFSCPPYHDIEKYSDDPADLSNMDYAKFCTLYRSIITKAMSKLKPNRFACFVVGDIRAKDGSYRNFVSETIDCFTKCLDDNGKPVMLYNDIVLINVVGSLAIRVGRQFEGYRKVGKMHQNVLVFYKGDPKKIKDDFPKIKIEECLHETELDPNIAL